MRGIWYVELARIVICCILLVSGVIYIVICYTIVVSGFIYIVICYIIVVSGVINITPPNILPWGMISID